MHKLLVRAIITGFGLRVGSELGKLVARKLFPPRDEEDGGEDDEDDERLGSMPPDVPEV